MSPEKTEKQQKIREIEAQPGETIIITISTIDRSTGKPKDIKMEVSDVEAEALLGIRRLVARFADEHLSFVQQPDDDIASIETHFDKPSRLLYDSMHTEGTSRDKIFSNVRTAVSTWLDGAPNRGIPGAQRQIVLDNTERVIQRRFTQYDYENGIFPEDELPT